jgi:hypothetical protein
MPNFSVGPSAVSVGSHADGSAKFNIYMTCDFDDPTKPLIFTPSSLPSLAANLPPIKSLRYFAAFPTISSGTGGELLDIGGPLIIKNSVGVIVAAGAAVPAMWPLNNAGTLETPYVNEGTQYASGLVPFFSPINSPITISIIPPFDYDTAQPVASYATQAQLCFMTYEQHAYTTAIVGANT